MFHFKFLLQCAKKMGSVKKPLCPLIHFVTLSLGKVSTDGLFWYTDHPCMVHRWFILVQRPSICGTPSIHFGTPTIHIWCTVDSFWYTDHPCTVHGWFILVHRPSMYRTPLIHFDTTTIHV